MLYSTKIKFIGIAGTFSIISLSYILHAKAFYEDLSIDTLELKAKQEIVKVLTDSDKNRTILGEDSSVVQKPKVVEQVSKQKITAIEPKSQDFVQMINLAISKDRYLYLDKSGKISKKSQKVLDEIAPMLFSVKDYYIEVEGHSAFQKSELLAQKSSEKNAKIVANYLKATDIKSEIKITGYGSKYPIIEDIKDMRNSRIELKLRRR